MKILSMKTIFAIAIYPLIIFLAADMLASGTIGRLTFLDLETRKTLMLIGALLGSGLYYFKIALPSTLVITKGNFGLIIFDPLHEFITRFFSKDKTPETTQTYVPKGQREIIAGGIEFKYPYETIQPEIIDLTWRQLDVPVKFRAKSEDGVEISFTGYLRLRPLVGGLVTFNQHRLEDIIAVFVGRMTKFLTEEINTLRAEVIPAHLALIEDAFNNHYKDKNVIDLDEAKYGVETDSFVLNDYVLPPEVEASNRLAKIMAKIKEEAIALMKADTTGTLTMKEALFFASVALGIIDPKMDIFSGLGALLGGRNQQGNGGRKKGEK